MGEEFRSVWVVWALRPSWVYSQCVSHNCGHLRLNWGKKSQFQDGSFSWLLAGGLISLPHGRLYRAACLQDIAISFFSGKSDSRESNAEATSLLWLASEILYLYFHTAWEGAWLPGGKTITDHLGGWLSLWISKCKLAEMRPSEEPSVTIL